MPIKLQANNGNINLKVPVMGGGIEQVQADWAQNDETAKDYIKNRFGGYVENGVATTLYDATPDSDGEVEITLFPLNTKVRMRCKLCMMLLIMDSSKRLSKMKR